MKNEIMGLQCITRIVLIPLQVCGIIKKDLEEKRREERNDHDGRASYLGGSSAHPQGIGVYSQDQTKNWSTGGDENRQSVESYTSCSQRLHQPPQTASTRNRTKIKAARKRQLKILVADDPIPKVLQAQGKRSSIATGAWPKLIIDGIPKYRQSPPLSRWVAINVPVASQEHVL